jgi:hypothetical protein
MDLEKNSQSTLELNDNKLISGDYEVNETMLMWAPFKYSLNHARHFKF